MKRATGILIIVALVGILLSCDVFFISKEGRYNFLDPKNEFVEVFPEIDGTAEDTSWYEFAPYVIASTMSPMSAIVMRFDVGKIPDDFERIYLRLYKLVMSDPAPTIRIHPIIADRLPVDYFDADQPDIYYDADNYLKFTVSTAEGYQLIDLSSLVGESTSTIRYGLIIFSEGDYVDFEAMETPEPIWQPRLYITAK